MRQSSRKIALGGILAALAVVIMCLGGLIPIATYVCPLICILMGQCVYRFCGRRIAWAWYAAVALLSLLVGPDKEAAGVYLILGYYPYLKPFFDRSKLRVLWKLLFFNASISVLYISLLLVTGMNATLKDYREFGLIGFAVLFALGNATFLLADRLLGRFSAK